MIYKIRNKEIEINVGDKILFNGSVYWMYTDVKYTPLTKNVISKLNLKWDKDVIGILGTKLEQLKVVECEK